MLVSYWLLNVDCGDMWRSGGAVADLKVFSGVEVITQLFG
jgi:hypothetical protein